MSQQRTKRPINPVNGSLNALWVQPWLSLVQSQVGLACSQPLEPGLWGATADTLESLSSTSVITLSLNSIWPSPLLWKTSWLCALWHLHIHLKETEPAFFFSWMNLGGKVSLSAPIRYRSWPKRSKSRVRRIGWGLVEKKWKSLCLVNGPLIPPPDRRQWQPGGGSGHQLAWIDTFLSRLQLSLLRASTDCNFSFFPPSWKSPQPFSCHWEAGRQLSVSSLTDE